MLSVNNISFSYTDKSTLSNIDFSVKKGQLLAIAGESGSGKSTLLKLIYGQYDLDKGSIFFKNHEILGPKFNLILGADFIKYVAQEFDLMPFTSVEKNIGEFLSNIYPKKKKIRTDELIRVVELEAYAKTKVKNLSGGQKQRVALARALAKKPEVLLLDEPFSHIDNLKKQSLRRNLFLYLKEHSITGIVATHDKDDILSYADKILFLNRGEIEAYGSPQDLYAKPKNKLIASFFDNFSQLALNEIIDTDKKDKVIIYPHEIAIHKDSRLKAQVKMCLFNGDHYLIIANFRSNELFIKSQTKLAIGSELGFVIDKAIINKRSLK